MSKAPIIDSFDDFVSFEELYDDYPSVKPRHWKEFAEGLKIQITTKRVCDFYGNQRRVRGLTQAEIDLISSEYVTPIATEDIISAFSLGQLLGHKAKTLITLSKKLSTFVFIYRFPNNKNSVGFDKEQVAELLDILNKIKIEKAETEHKYISCFKICSEYKIGRKTLNIFLEQEKIETEQYITRLGVLGYRITIEEYQKIAPLLDKYIERRPGTDIKSLLDWKNAKNIPIKALIELAEGIGITPQTYLFTRNDGQGLSKAEIELIETSYAEFNLPENKPITVKNAAIETGLSIDDLNCLGSDIGIVPYNRLFKKSRWPSYTQGEIAKITEVYTPFNLALC